MKREDAATMLAQAQIDLDDIRRQRQTWVEATTALFNNESASKRELHAQIKKSKPMGKTLLRLKKTMVKVAVLYQKTDADGYSAVAELLSHVGEEYHMLRKHAVQYSDMFVRRVFVRLDKLANQETVPMPTLWLDPTRHARGSEIPKQSQRVFICWDKKLASPKDQLVDDILSRDIGVDCVVSYYDMFLQKTPDDETIMNELLDTQLVVLLVTPSFLQQNKQADSPEFRIAKELNRQGKLPVLPVVENAGLFSALTLSEKAIHGVAMDDPEYRSKLGEQLSAFIITSEIVREISAKAFSGRVFLSYRKKDIEKARAFMKAFHDTPGYESIAVWYDNYLTAGRVFDKEIRDSIDSADVFVLLVTPKLFEKNDAGETNFVLAEELPYAVEKGKKIVAVEAAPVGRSAFESICSDYEAYLTFDQLYEMLSIFPDDSAKFVFCDEQAYFLGLAYRWGILVEHDIERAEALFAQAREAVSIWGVKAALEEIRLWNALGVSIPYEKGLKLYDDLVNAQKTVLGEDHPDISVSLSNLADMLRSYNKYEDALYFYYTALARNEKLLGFGHPLVASNCESIGSICAEIGNFDDAMSYFKRALAIWSKEEGTGLNTARVYHNTALAYKRKGEYKNALDLYKKAYDINKRARGPNDEKTLETLGSIAVLYASFGKEGKALNTYTKILKIQEKTYGMESPGAAKTCTEIASIVYGLQDYTEAIEWLDMAKKTQEKLAMLGHPDLAKTYSLMGIAYAKQDMHEDAKIMNEAALELYLKYLGGEETLTLAWYYANGALVSFCRGDFAEEIKYYEKILTIHENIYGTEDAETRRAIAEAMRRSGADNL